MVLEAFIPWKIKSIGDYPKSYREAKDRGLTRYWSDIPCINGHIGWKSTAKRCCLWCTKLAVKSWRQRKKKEKLDKINKQKISFFQYDEIISRKEAKDKGLTKYFTGFLCKRGHIAPRCTSSAHCFECRRMLQNKIYKENPDQKKESNKKSVNKIIEYVREYHRSYRDKNKDKMIEYFRGYYANEKRGLKTLAYGAINRARTTNKEYDKDYLLDLIKTPPDICPCCREKINYKKERNTNGKKIRNMKSPSLDRVDNALGYIKNNVNIICWKCNIKKSNLTKSDLLMLLAYIRNKE